MLRLQRRDPQLQALGLEHGDLPLPVTSLLA
jgi:hypothetical protein